MKSIFYNIRFFLKNPQKCRKWGQVCLITAILLNGFVLAVSLHLSNLQGMLQEKRYDEYYYILNDHTKKDELMKYRLFLSHSNQLVLLRRLAEKQLSCDERNTVSDIVRELNRLSENSNKYVNAIAYLQTNEPPEGVNPFEMFDGMDDNELIRMRYKYEDQAILYLDGLKKKMLQLMNKIAIWNHLHTIVLILSSIILIIGSVLNFHSEVSNKSSR